MIPGYSQRDGERDARDEGHEGGEGDGDPIIGEQRDMIEMLAELPDLWDININNYYFGSLTLFNRLFNRLFNAEFRQIKLL